MKLQQPKLRKMTLGLMGFAVAGGTLGAVLFVVGGLMVIVGSTWVVAAVGAVLLAAAGISFRVGREMTRKDLKAWSDSVMQVARASGIPDVEGLIARLKENRQDAA